MRPVWRRKMLRLMLEDARGEVLGGFLPKLGNFRDNRSLRLTGSSWLMPIPSRLPEAFPFYIMIWRKYVQNLMWKKYLCLLLVLTKMSINSGLTLPENETWHEQSFLRSHVCHLVSLVDTDLHCPSQIHQHCKQHLNLKIHCPFPMRSIFLH